MVVQGPAGSGKTRLLAQHVAALEAGERSLVLATRSARGVPLSPSRIASDVNRRVEDSPLCLRLPGQGGERLGTQAGAAEGWWHELRALNPDRWFHVVIDGLDDAGDAPGGSQTPLTAILPPPDLAGCSVLLGWRSLAEVGQGQRAPLAAFAASAVTLDLGAFYRTTEGADVLRSYLVARHPRLVGEVPLAAVPAALAARLPGAADGRPVGVRELVLASAGSCLLFC